VPDFTRKSFTLSLHRSLDWLALALETVVLSAEQYRTAAPGSAKKDATILPAYPWW
jgi:hypothetical protein